MDSPQLEDGYTRIANEILEELAKTQLSGHEWRLVMVIWRQTYGWTKKEDSIALSQFVNRTEMPKARCAEALESLCSRKIIIRTVPENRYSQPRIYSFNKHFSGWARVPEKRYTGKAIQGVPENRTQEYRKNGTTKETTKERIKEKPERATLGHFSEQISEEIIKELKALCLDLERTWSKFNPYQAVQRWAKKYHHEAILHVLRRMAKEKELIISPWGFANKVIEQESMNYHARDGEAKHVADIKAFAIIAKNFNIRDLTG